MAAVLVYGLGKAIWDSRLWLYKDMCNRENIMGLVIYD